MIDGEQLFRVYAIPTHFAIALPSRIVAPPCALTVVVVAIARMVDLKEAWMRARVASGGKRWITVKSMRIVKKSSHCNFLARRRRACVI